jgi:mannose-1-phosphate guanylyltransferase/mannose-6-phosphate isomerase
MNNKPLVLILCGGRSLRLWPLSQYLSKNFINVFGFSPLELTIKRFLKVTSKDNIFLVANQKERKDLSKIKLIKKSNIFFEPESKNTGPAVLLSLLNLPKYSARNIVIVPVDSLIKQEKQFYRALNKALKVASQGFICIFGIKPNLPSPKFGYIQVEKSKKGQVFSVKRFIEKPSPAKAKKLISSGNCFYNSGMFIAKVDTLLKEFKKYYPYYNNFIKDFKVKISSLYRKIEDIPFDKAVMEKTKKAKLVKSNFFWKDFGSWDTIYEVLSKDKSGNAAKGSAFIHEGKNNLIYLDSLKKKVLVIGLKDFFFIDTKDYSLLTNRANLDNLKLALKKFKQTE